MVDTGRRQYGPHGYEVYPCARINVENNEEERKKMKTKMTCAVLIAAVLMASVPAFAQSTILQEQNIETKKGGLLTVQVDSSDVSVSSWNKDRVMVTVRGLKKTEKVLDIVIVEESEGVAVSVRKAEGGKKILGWGGVQFTSVDIIVPESYRMIMRTSGGDITINNISGAKDLDSGGGDIGLVGTAGDIRAFSEGGDISISSNNGSVDLSSGGGDIRALMINGAVQATSDGGTIVLDSTDGPVSAYSASGDCSISFRGKNNGIEARTTSGDLDLKTSASIKANLLAHTGSGMIIVQYPGADVSEKSFVSYKADINGGGKEIRLRTESGNIEAGPAK